MACVPFKPLVLKTITSMLPPPPSQKLVQVPLWGPASYDIIISVFFETYEAADLQKTKNLIIGADKAMTIPQLDNI